MNGVDFFVDTNILLYIMDGRPEVSHVSQFVTADMDLKKIKGADIVILDLIR